MPADRNAVVKLLLGVILSLSVTKIYSQENFTWIRLGGPPGGLGYDIRYKLDAPDVWYVTDANAGVHRSLDNGTLWESVNTGIETYSGPTNDIIPVFCLTVNPHDPMIVWAGTQGNGQLYKSEDAGVTWVEKDNGITIEYDQLTFRGITFDPVSPEILYAMGEITDESLGGPAVWGSGTGGVVYRSTDSGENWEKIWDGGVPSSLTRYMWIHPKNTDILYVSTGIFDRGAVGEGDIITDPFGGLGILKSIDGGDTWTVQDENNGLRCLYLGSLYMHPLHPDTLLTCAGHVLADGRGIEYIQNIIDLGGISPFGVYRTIDGGMNWTQVLANGLGEVFASVEYSTLNPNIAYAASASAVYRSEDAGETWTKVSIREGNWGPSGVNTGFPIDIQCDPRNSDRLYINNYAGGNYLSEDGGQTWTNASNGYTGSRPRKVTVSPYDPTIIYAVGPSGIWQSIDAGTSWNGIHFSSVDSIISADYSFILADKNIKGHYFAANVGSQILETFNAGSSWEFIWPGFDELGEPIGYGAEISDMIYAPSDQNVIYAGLSNPGCSFSTDPCGSGMGVVFSEDGGKTWEPSADDSIKNIAVISLAVNPANDRDVYAGTEKGLYFSSDGALSWSKVTSVPVNGRIRAVTYNPENPEQLFIGIEGFGMYRSDNGGTSWIPVVAGLQPNSSLRKIIFNPQDNSLIYTCDLFSGVYFSQDGGETWIMMNDSLFNRAVTDLSISSDGQHMYASTLGNGVYRLDFNGEPPVSPELPNLYDHKTDTEVEIFPNPVSDNLYVMSNADIAKIELYDILGNLLFSIANKPMVDMSYLPSGFYNAIITLKTENTRIHKVVIKH